MDPPDPVTAVRTSINVRRSHKNRHFASTLIVAIRSRKLEAQSEEPGFFWLLLGQPAHGRLSTGIGHSIEGRIALHGIKAQNGECFKNMLNS